MNARCRNCAVLIGLVSLWLSFAPPARAQVAIWPGLVIAPCVRVEWNGQRVHVCAPFVNVVVDWPGCCRCCDCRPACGDAGGTHGGTSDYSYDHPTRQQLALAAAKLNRSLEQFQTADSWQHYLALNDLALAPGQAFPTDHFKPANSVDAAASVDTDSTAELVATLRHFDAANRDGRYGAITALPDFQQTHTLLANYLAQQPNSATAAANSSRTTSTEPTKPGLSSSGFSQGTQLGWAVDTARMPAASEAQSLTAEAVQPPTMVRPATEELPPPQPKGGI